MITCCVSRSMADYQATTTKELSSAMQQVESMQRRVVETEKRLQELQEANERLEVHFSHTVWLTCPMDYSVYFYATG